MVHFPSDLSYDELVAQWDEHTSPARFAGNDDSMDLIFVSKRKGNKVKLVRRARTAREPFSTVFRGKIVETEKGSEVVGYFTKALSDYAFAAGLIALLFYIRSIIIERAEALNTINIFLVIAIAGCSLLLMNLRPAKRRYADFIYRITGVDTGLFLSRREVDERSGENGQSE